MKTRKVQFPTDKRQWHPSLIPGPIALISTVDKDGTPNVAPKSWLQMVSFEPSILMFSGQPDGKTEANILATRCFGVNLVQGALASRVFDCITWQGTERIEKSGFKLVPAQKIQAPLVDDCFAHLECTLVDQLRVGSALVVFGDIVGASISEHVSDKPERLRYCMLDQAVFLEDGLYATIDAAHPAQPEEELTNSIRHVYLMSHARTELLKPELIRSHVAYMKTLEERGLIELCGPFPDDKGGMVILRGVTEEEARSIAEADPFIATGAETYELRKFELSRRDNNHLGMG